MNYPLNPISYAIHKRAIMRAKNFSLAQGELIESLREVESDQTYKMLGLTSLYQYARKFMNLSEDVSCQMIAIMRKSRAVPELAEKIKDGSISVTNAKKIVSVLTKENKDEWLKLAETKSSRELEKAVVTENPKLAVTESLHYKSAARLELKLGVSEDFTEALKLAKDVASQKLKRAVSTEEILLITLNDYIDRNDLLRKAERAKARTEKAAVQSNFVEIEHKEIVRPRNTSNQTNQTQDLSVARRINLEGEKSEARGKDTCKHQTSTRLGHADVSHPLKRSRYIPSALKYAVTLRDQRRCRYIHEDGSRCEQTRWLDVHHVIHRSNGGADEFENLVTLCSFHHRLRHDREGERIRKMTDYSKGNEPLIH